MSDDRNARPEPEIRVERKEQEEEQSSDAGSDNKQKQSGTSVWEWVIAGISTLLVLGAIGLMVHDAMTPSGGPPQITLSVDTIVEAGHGYDVQFQARNSSSATAAALLVEGELRSDTGHVETSQATIDYVPAGATRRGGLFFSEDPRLHTLQLRPKGYDRP